MDNFLIDGVKKKVADLFNEHYDKRSTYHSYSHTKEVVEAADKIGKAVGLNNDEMEMVLIAAWFHDTGYLFDKQDHELQSSRLAEEYLKTLNYPESKLQLVKNNILATRVEHTPANLMEEVIHDADYINLANPDNLKQSEMLRDEIVNYGGQKPTEEEWLTAELKFLLNHRYYTEYSRNKLESKKADNIKKIKKRLKEFRKDEALTETLTQKPVKQMEMPNSESSEKPVQKKREFPENKNGEDKGDKDKKKTDKQDKQVTFSVKEFGTIYRLVATNHMRMNAIADRKANIMLSLNAIIISLSMGIVASTSEYTLRFLIPTSILILVCLVTIIFAALSTRPKVTTDTVDKENIREKKANLLFFGNFSQMEYEEFDWGFRQLITDQEYLHNSMIQDFYSLGKVLDIKYRYLRICYNVFMYGIIASVLSIPVMIILGF